MSDSLRHGWEATTSIRLVMGTAQLGMAYGIANQTGKPSDDTAREIIKYAWDCGIRHFDTAMDYGDCQTRLGTIFRDLNIGKEAHVITKLDDISEQSPTVQIGIAKAQLGIERLWGVLLHREEDIDLVASASPLLRLAEHFGVSVYSPEVVMRAFGIADMDLLQIPASIFDRRFLIPSILMGARDTGVQIMVRSIFLQGLALMDPSRVSETIPHALEAVRALDSFCRKRRLDRKIFCIQYVAYKCRDVSPMLLFGAETKRQLEEIALAAAAPPLSEEHFSQWDSIWPEDYLDLVNPTRWRKISSD